jgi:hypothetical protein
VARLHTTLDCAVRGKRSTLHPWGETKSQDIEIGKQFKPDKSELIDTILHEEMEARIVNESYRSDKCKQLDRGGEKTTHLYLVPIVERFLRMKGLSDGSH